MADEDMIDVLNRELDFHVLPDHIREKLYAIEAERDEAQKAFTALTNLHAAACDERRDLRAAIAAHREAMTSIAEASPEDLELWSVLDRAVTSGREQRP